MNIISLVLCSILGVCFGSLELDVHISDGPLRGQELTSRLGRPFVAFKGIPFAKPPLGDLRFAPAEPPTPWTEVRTNPDIVPICLQRTLHADELKIRGDEDCLYLNVYTPQVSSESKLPVMIYFHGGGLETGAGTSEFYGPTFLLDKDIVLVVTNYRLGPLGFLSTDDAVVPGNEGLKDQLAAMKWVRNNIKHFGGDPDLVTIFGESAGGASVETHMVSPLSKGYFHRAIIQSGAMTCPWFIVPKNTLLQESRRLAAHLGCKVFNSTELVTCLRTREAYDIIEALSIFHEWDIDPQFIFRVVVESPEAGDARILPDQPENLLADPSAISPVPVMIGLTSEEGSLKIARFVKQQDLLKEFSHDYERLMPISLYYKYSMDKSDILPMTKKIKEFYFGEETIGNNTLKGLIDLYSDFWFTIDMDPSVRKHAAVPNVNVYYYYFSYRGDKSLSGFFGHPDIDLGVCHADELLYLFPYEIFMNGHVRSETDQEMITLMTDIWTVFAKSGVPPASLKWTPVPFKPSDSDPLPYLDIATAKNTKVKSGLFQERKKFWESLKKTSPSETKKDEL